MGFPWRINLRELLFGAAPPDFDPEEDQVATDLEVSYYNYRFVRHRAEGDLVENPGFLWSSNAYWKRRGGLGEHLTREGEALDGVVYTDALVVLSEADWRRTQTRLVTPWEETAREVLAERYELLVGRNRLQPIVAGREFQLRVVRDGDPRMGSERFGLEQGEFLTGLMPHLYHGPIGSSALLAEVFLRLPGWGGELRKVGALYSDQVAFTVGNHWLDSYQDLDLAEPALYHLHHFPGTERIEHRINLERHDRYRIGAPEKGPAGEELLPLLRVGDGAKVLEVMLVRPPVGKKPVPFKEAPAADNARAPSTSRQVGSSAAALESAGERSAQAETTPPAGRKPVPAATPPRGSAAVSLAETVRVPLAESDPTPAGEPEKGEAQPSGEPRDERMERRAAAFRRFVDADTIIARPGVLLPGETPAGSRLTLGADPSIGARTIIPEPPDPQALLLTERGILLQKVHFPQIMAGYTVNLGSTGHIGLAVRQPFARLRVEADRVWLEALLPGTFLNGERVSVGQSREISLGGHRITRGATVFEYHALRRASIPGWPYLAELRRPPLTRPLPSGRSFRIGRNRRTCAIPLPDHVDQSNILWRTDIGTAESVAGADGAIAKARIYTDSIMVAGEHAELANEGPLPVLSNISERCHVFIRRPGDEVVALPPKRDVVASSVLRSGDEVLLGNNLYRVTFDEVVRSQPASQGRRARRPGETTRLFPLATERAGTGDGPPPSAPPASSPAPGPISAATPKRVVPPAPVPGPVAAAPAPKSMRSPVPAKTGSIALLSADIGMPAALEVPPPGAMSGTGPVDHPTFPVVYRDEAVWSMDLRRPARLVLIGWAVAGRVSAGNHTGADIVIPENRMQRGQCFAPRDYFTAFIRGGRARIDPTATSDVALLHPAPGGPADGKREDPLEGLELQVVRRDAHDEVDFLVRLSFPTDGPPLPRPRSRLLAIGLNEADRGLFSWGLPDADPRPLRLGDIAVRVRWTPEGARIEGYLEDYRRPDGGFRELYLLEPGAAHTRQYRAAPEDGRPLLLAPGSLIVAGSLVYRVER